MSIFPIIYFSTPQDTTFHDGIFVILLFSSSFSPQLASSLLLMNTCLPSLPLFFIFLSVTSHILSDCISQILELLDRFQYCFPSPITMIFIHLTYPLVFYITALHFVLLVFISMPDSSKASSAWFIPSCASTHLSLLNHQQNMCYLLVFHWFWIHLSSFSRSVHCILYVEDN